ncbi:MAG: hypothetical protein EXX96DRAFT_603654 [Benjaminiella poitrasii]|nr:MAG: hypothetical protein EXX96DRAFT_603654 [Benjaminiella poitrasii]
MARIGYTSSANLRKTIKLNEVKRVNKEVKKELNVGSSCTEVNNSSTGPSSHSACRGFNRRPRMRNLLYNSANQLGRRNMVLPLQNTPGTLPLDNASTTLPSIPSPLSSEINNHSTNASASLRSYPDVASISSEKRGSSNDAFRHLVHRTGTTDHSVFYHVPKNLSPLHSALVVQLRELFSIGVDLRLTSSDDANGTNIEIVLATKADCDAAIASPVVIKDSKFHSSLASCMGKHCVYCKETGHYRKECTLAPAEKRRCYQCSNSGHIARNCFRVKTDDTTSSKCRRESRPSNKTSALTLPPPPSGTLDQLLDDSAPSVGQDNATGLSKETNKPLNVTAELPTVIDTGAATASKMTMRSERPKRTNAGKNTTLKDYFPLTPATKPCKCGGTDHQRTTSLKCPLNKKNLANSSLVGGTTSSDNDNEDNHENGHDSDLERITSPAAGDSATSSDMEED